MSRMRARVARVEAKLRPPGRLVVWFRAGRDFWERCIVAPDSTPDMPRAATRAEIDQLRRSRPEDTFIVDREHA